MTTQELADKLGIAESTLKGYRISFRKKTNDDFAPKVNGRILFSDVHISCIECLLELKNKDFTIDEAIDLIAPIYNHNPFNLQIDKRENNIQILLNVPLEKPLD